MKKSLSTKHILLTGIFFLLVTNLILAVTLFRNNPSTDTQSSRIDQSTPPVSQTPLHQYQKSENKNAYIQSQMADCAASRGLDNCYQKIAENLRKSFTLTDSLNLLADNESYPAVYSRCHEVTHYMGRGAYKESQNLPATIVSCDSTCQGGCYHGVVEEYLKEHDNNLSGDSLKTTFTSICDSKSLSPLVFAECEHGLGHAAMFVTDNQLTNSLTMCDNLEGLSDREHCYSGVFMEYSSSSTNSTVADQTMHPTDPLYPCDKLSSQYLKLCYEYQSSYFSIITHYDAKATAELCLKVPTQYQEGCIQIIGGGQVGLTRDVSVMSHNCSLMPNTSYRQICNTGVVSSLATRYVGHIDNLANFCAVVAKDDQPMCFGNIGRAVVLWGGKGKTKEVYCNQISDSNYSSWCLSNS